MEINLKCRDGEGVQLEVVLKRSNETWINKSILGAGKDEIVEHSKT